MSTLLPEIEQATSRYWDDDGPEGEDSGPYIHVSSVLEPFVKILLTLEPTPERDALLGKALDLVEAMVSADDRMVSDLAVIEFLENADAWWLSRAKPFLGKSCRAYLAEFHAEWGCLKDQEPVPEEALEIIDLYDVRSTIVARLGLAEVAVAGIAAPRSWTALQSLDLARENSEGVAFLSCFGTSRPYVIAPIAEVQCDAAALQELAVHLAKADGTEPDQHMKANVFFFTIRQGERVWQMNHSESECHTRWHGELWISPRIKFLGHEAAIRDVLAGRPLR